MDNATEINVRHARQEDIKKIAETEGICFSDPQSEQDVAAELENGMYTVLVAETNGCVAGHIIGFCVCDEAEIISLGVDPEKRRRGVAGMLLDSFISEKRKNGSVSVFLEVRVSNTPAISLYSSRDFEKIGVRKNFYSNPSEDGYIMKKILKGTVE